MKRFLKSEIILKTIRMNCFFLIIFWLLSPNLFSQKSFKDSAEFSLNNYLADIENVNSFISLTEVEIVKDSVLKADIERWNNYDKYVDTIIGNINVKFNNTFRFRQVSDLKKEISYWELQTNKLVRESQAYEELLKSSLLNCNSYDSLLKKYIDSNLNTKSINNSDLIRLNTVRGNIKKLKNKIIKQNNKYKDSAVLVSKITKNQNLIESGLMR